VIFCFLLATGTVLTINTQQQPAGDDAPVGSESEGPFVSYRILVLTPLCSKSHVIAYAPLLNELAARGHRVTAVVPHVVPSLDPTIEVLTDDELKKMAWEIFQYQVRRLFMRTVQLSRAGSANWNSHLHCIRTNKLLAIRICIASHLHINLHSHF
jgi:hypothetical protein